MLQSCLYIHFVLLINLSLLTNQIDFHSDLILSQICRTLINVLRCSQTIGSYPSFSLIDDFILDAIGTNTSLLQLKLFDFFIWLTN